MLIQITFDKQFPKFRFESNNLMRNDIRRKTTSTQNTQDQIRLLQEEIESLQEELKAITVRGNSQTTRNRNKQGSTAEDQFVIGDRVVVLNSYGGNRGATATVTHITPKQVSIRIDGQRKVINKYRTSVQRI